MQYQHIDAAIAQQFLTEWMSRQTPACTDTCTAFRHQGRTFTYGDLKDEMESRTRLGSKLTLSLLLIRSREGSCPQERTDADVRTTLLSFDDLRLAIGEDLPHSPFFPGTGLTGRFTERSPFSSPFRSGPLEL